MARRPKPRPIRSAPLAPRELPALPYPSSAELASLATACGLPADDPARRALGWRETFAYRQPIVIEAEPAEARRRLAGCLLLPERFRRAYQGMQLWTTLAFFATVACVMGGCLAWWLTPLAVLAAAILVLAITRFAALATFDPDPRRLVLACELVRHLAADLDPKKKLRVRVDLRSPDAESFERGRPVVHGDHRRARYRQPWFELRGRLANGDRLSMRLSLFVKRREKGKARRREQYRERVQVSITPHGTWRRKPHLKLSGLSSKLRLRLVDFRDGRLTAFGFIGPVERAFRGLAWNRLHPIEGYLADHHLVLKLLLSMYAVLHPARPTERR